ncbi:MAG: PAS domain S-box protein [Eubacteriales bacterium]|nr:PAS domain S-box protein [Eubacteriales bacterium]
MKTKEMNKEQLIARIDVLNKQITELKAVEAQQRKIEEELRSSDERFRFLFNTAPIGLSISNAQGDILNANRTIQELLGYTMKELRSMNFIDFYTDPDERQRLLDNLIKSNHVRDFETKFKHKDGSIWSVLMNSDYINMGDDKVLLTSIHDITRFKQIQEDLMESEERYHVLFSNAPVGITVTDFRGHFSASNQAIQELLGYTAEEFKNKNIADFYDDKTARQRLLGLTEKYGVVRDFETKFVKSNGELITVLINTDLIDLKEQNKVLLTSIRDISSLKKVEEALTKERDFTNAILNTTASLILVIDREARITRFNRACEKTTGYSFHEIKGQHMWDTLSANPELTREKVKKLLDGNYPSAHENFWRTKDGETRLISWSNTVLLDVKGEVEYIIGTGIDITERRQAETELQQANQKLAGWVSELEKKSAQMSQLSEMGDQLQSCQNIEEACAISAQYIQMICPASQGALYLINPSKDLAEAVAMWGDPDSIEKVFLPINCWAIRRSHAHQVDEAHPGLRCGHITGPQTGQYLCVPMMAHGETLGILHLSYTKQDQQNSTGILFKEYKTQLAVAEHIAMALSNLRLRETLRQQSIRDTLTGLFNRRYMEETLTRELHRAEREKTPIGVIMFDIDHFKEFNDLSGHDGGDSLLRELGAFLKKSTRGGDVVCRYGGEEFTVVLPGANLENSRLRAEDLRQGVKELLVYYLGKPLGKCTISLGVAAFPEHGMTGEEILKSADSALYRAKNEGRDRVVVASVIG